MVLEKAVNRLRGEVTVRVRAPFPERVLNLCSARGLRLWDVCWVSPEEFTCRMSRGDWAALRRAADGLDCTLRAERRAGAPFLLGRLRSRRALAAGLLACAGALVLGSFFIWDFRIEGNVTVSDQQILRALEKNGVGLGTFGLSVDGEDLRNHVLLELPRLSWIAVNVSGCRASVQVRERVPAPALADRRTPCNLVARRDGLVLRVQALGGVKQVLPGTVVTRGQLLISGVEDTGTVGARMTAGMGRVWARTWYTLETRVPLTVEQKVFTGAVHRRLSLCFGRKRIKFCGNGSYLPGSYDKITRRTQLRFFGLATPLTAEEELLRPYALRAAALSRAQAEQRGRAVLSAYLHTLLAEGDSVRSALCSSRSDGGALRVTLTAECVEQIGEQSPVYAEINQPDGP